MASFADLIKRAVSSAENSAKDLGFSNNAKGGFGGNSGELTTDEREASKAKPDWASNPDAFKSQFQSALDRLKQMSDEKRAEEEKQKAEEEAAAAAKAEQDQANYEKNGDAWKAEGLQWANMLGNPFAATLDETSVPNLERQAKAQGTTAAKEALGLAENYGSETDYGDNVNEDDFDAVARRWLKNHGYDQEIFDFAGSATKDQWKEFMLDPEIAKFYGKQFAKFGNGETLTDEEFDKYWDYYKPYDPSYWWASDGMSAYGTDADVNRDVINYLLDTGAYNTGYSEEELNKDDVRDFAIELAMYELLDRYAQNAIENGWDPDDFAASFTNYDLQQLGKADTYEFTREDGEGTYDIKEEGKANYAPHSSSDYDIDLFNQYGVPIAGVPDAIYEASDGKIRVKKKDQDQWLINRYGLGDEEGGN